jgi:hypothetical protein
MKRVFVIVVGLLFIGGMLGFGQTLNYGTFKPTKNLTIRIETDKSGPPSKPAVQDVVTPALRAKTMVTAEPYPTPPALGSSAAARVQAQVAGNNMPDVYTETYTTPQPDGQQVLVDNNAAWDFSDKAFLKKMFPNFTARIAQYGSLDDWYANETTVNGTHLRISSSIQPVAFTKLFAAQKGTTWARVNTPVMSTYMKYVRDDILKMIYPKARSDKEQEQFYLTKFDYASPTAASDPFADIPVNTLDDMYKFMVKIKEIIDSKNLMDGAGRDKMIAAQLNASNGSRTSVMWSGIGMYGYQWVEPPFRVGDRAYYNFQEPWVKNVFQWWNKCYNDGLFDPELFVKKDDQVGEEIVRGRFAIFSDMTGKQAAARAFSKDNKLGYGWRYMSSNFPMTLVSTYSNAKNKFVSYFSHVGNIISKSVKEADLQQVCNWLDYQYSEEFDILASWGPSSFSTGTGKDRRFKPAYKDLENFQAYGITNPNGKDGYYYGVTRNAPISLDPSTSNPEVTSGFLTAYPYAPRYVYPFKKVAGADYDTEMRNAWAAWWTNKLGLNLIPQVGWSDSDLNNLPNFGKIRYMWFGSHDPSIAKMVVGSAADFESNYAGYMKVFRDNDWDLGMTEYNLKWKEIFDNYVQKYWKN